MRIDNIRLYNVGYPWDYQGSTKLANGCYVLQHQHGECITTYDQPVNGTFDPQKYMAISVLLEVQTADFYIWSDAVKGGQVSFEDNNGHWQAIPRKSKLTEDALRHLDPPEAWAALEIANVMPDVLPWIARLVPPDPASAQALGAILLVRGNPKVTIGAGGPSARAKVLTQSTVGAVVYFSEPHNLASITADWQTYWGTTRITFNWRMHTSGGPNLYANIEYLK